MVSTVPDFIKSWIIECLGRKLTASITKSIVSCCIYVIQFSVQISVACTWNNYSHSLWNLVFLAASDIVSRLLKTDKEKKRIQYYYTRSNTGSMQWLHDNWRRRIWHVCMEEIQNVILLMKTLSHIKAKKRNR